MCQFQPGDSVQVTAGVCGTVVRREVLGGRVNLIVRLPNGDLFTLACTAAVRCPGFVRAFTARTTKTESGTQGKKKKTAKRARRAKRT